MSTIAAISTPLAVGGISVIRISGENAIKIASSVFQPLSCKSVERMEGYTCAYGKVVSKNQEIDDGILTVFRSPKSYTGEDVCEISCHGGIYVTKQVLQIVLENGAKPAENGEFTKRAFLNGKLSLTQAEAVMDIINAQGRQAHRSAVSTREGTLFARINKSTQKLISILAQLSAWVDYPDEDIEDVSPEAFHNTLSEINTELCSLLETYDSGRILREGVDTVIAGKPNVGKSTLMNMLLGFDRSIVTDIKGTTRDVVEESVRLGDIVLRLSDTAGIRDTSDIVEGVGVKLAYKKLDEADLVIAVFDNSEVLSDEDKELIDKIVDKPSVAVINKSDLEQKLDRTILSTHFSKVVEISAKNSEGKEELTSVLEDILKVSNFDPNAGVICNERQRNCVISAQKNIEKAISDLSVGETYDAITVLLDEATNSLLELTGEKATEAVVDNVFANFCVGK